MKLEVGMYVRTKDGYIAKFIKEEKYLEDGETIETTSYQFDHNIDKYSDCVNYVYAEDMIVKEPSYNIIDLIEVGDILIIKDFVDEACMVFTDIYLIQSEAQLLNIKSDLEKNKNKKLYSIVTKEQFENIEYKFGVVM